MDHVVIFGASRGLGAALVKQLNDQNVRVSGWARKMARLQRFAGENQKFSPYVADFSTKLGQETAVEFLLKETTARIFLIAGGGPYGPYAKPEWKDHEWAWNVTFCFPARVLYTLSRMAARPQVILIGSSVAESVPDPGAASYCAAKHALRGLYQTIRAELPEWDVRLFSPGYMDTEMLPANAAVRKSGVYDPALMARDLWQWTLTGAAGSHKMWPNHPIRENT